MRAREYIKEIDNFAMSEKLIIVEEIWNSIANSNNELSITEWQKNELDKRYNNYKNGNLKLHDWKEVHKKLRKS